MFSIRLLPESETCREGQRLGEIVVGTFRERFACTIGGVRDGSLESQWQKALAGLMSGSSVVVLPHDPRFAWIVYRESDKCYVQQRFSRDGRFEGLLPRQITTEQGSPVSEWDTTLDAIGNFIGPNPAFQRTASPPLN